MALGDAFRIHSRFYQKICKLEIIHGRSTRTFLTPCPPPIAMISIVTNEWQYILPIEASSALTTTLFKLGQPLSSRRTITSLSFAFHLSIATLKSLFQPNHIPTKLCLKAIILRTKASDPIRTRASDPIRTRASEPELPIPSRAPPIPPSMAPRISLTRPSR